jgi:hypothetical protein
MPKRTSISADVHPLEALLEKKDEGLKRLFVKVMNLHAGFQIEERTQKQLFDAVRKEIEQSLPEQSN